MNLEWLSLSLSQRIFVGNTVLITTSKREWKIQKREIRGKYYTELYSKSDAVPFFQMEFKAESCSPENIRTALQHIIANDKDKQIEFKIVNKFGETSEEFEVVL